MEHGLKDIAFYVKKHTNTLQSFHNFPAGSQQQKKPLEAPTSVKRVYLKASSVSFIRGSHPCKINAIPSQYYRLPLIIDSVES